jgi:hypothetical protein
MIIDNGSNGPYKTITVTQNIGYREGTSSSWVLDLAMPANDDPVVKSGLTDDFVEKMRAAGAHIEYLKVDGVGHGVVYMDKLDITDPAMEKFFAKYLKPEL